MLSDDLDGGHSAPIMYEDTNNYKESNSDDDADQDVNNNNYNNKYHKQ